LIGNARLADFGAAEIFLCRAPCSGIFRRPQGDIGARHDDQPRQPLGFARSPEIIAALGSKANLTARKSDFRFAPESGRKTDIAACPKDAKSGHE
jgi:hypothetical protein